MDSAIQVDYNENLRGILREQSKRMAEFKFLLKVNKPCNQNLPDKYYMIKLQREFFNGKSKNLKLLPKSHTLKLTKSKQDRLSIIKNRTDTTEKFKLTKQLNSEKLWILNPSDNIHEIRKEISKLRKKHGIEKFNKHIKMYYYNYNHLMISKNI
jgi:hypothetical protein